MLSKLQTNLIKLQRKLQVGDKLIYSDMANYMQFEVIEVNKNIFSTKDIETGEIQERNLFNLQHGWDFENSYFKELCLLSNDYKESLNKEAYGNDMQKYVEDIKPFFNFEYSGFNTQGGFGWEVQTEQFNIYLWFYDPENKNDILPEDYEIGKKYKLAIHVDYNKDNEVNLFVNIDDAIAFVKQINE